MSKHNEAAAALQSSVAQYAQTLGEEALVLRAELEQLGTLLADAASRLEASFESVSVLSERQCVLALRTGQSGSELDAISQDLQRSLGKAATALQFHDISSQLLARAFRRVDRMGRMSAQLKGLAGNSGIEAAPPPGFAVQRDNSVGQSLMATGKFELF